MYLEKTLSIWDDSIGTGAVSARQVAALPLALLGATFEALNLPASSFQKIIFYGWFAGSGLAMWFLCIIFGLKRIARVNAVLLYMVSPYALAVIWSQTDGLIMPGYAGLPLGLALFVHGFRNNKPLQTAITGNFLLLLSMVSVVFQNPAYAILFWAPLLLAAILLPLLRVVTWLQTIKTTVFFGAIWLLMNAFWIAPLLASLTDEFQQASHQILQAEDPSRIFRSDLDTYAINSVSAIDALRMTGLWSLTASSAGDPYYIWGELTKSWWWLIASLLIPIVMIVGIIQRHHRQAAALFSLLFIIGTFLIIGTHEPGTNIRLALLSALPELLRAFRAVYSKIGLFLALGAAPLFGLGISAIYNTPQPSIRHFYRIGALCIALLVIGVGGWPAWSGSVINPGGHVLQPARVRIPSSYDALHEWESTQEDVFRILPLPISKTGSTAYRWQDSGYIGGDFIRSYLPNHPILFAGTRNPLMLALVQSIDQPLFTNREAIQKTLGLLNARYVLVHEDFHWPANANFMMFNDQSKINSFAYNNGWFSHSQSWDDLVLLEPTQPSWLPKIYATAAPTYVVSAGANIADALALPDQPARPALYLHDPYTLTDANKAVSQLTDDVIVTTAIDDAALTQARLDLSDARSAQSPFVNKREVEIELIQRSFPLGRDSSLLIPQAGDYIIYIASAWLADQQAAVAVTITDSDNQVYSVNNPRQALETSQHYQQLGHLNLPAGSHQLAVSVGGRPLTALPPGTLTFHKLSPPVTTPTPIITVQQQSPYQYTALVQDATAPFIMVLSETYHPGWRAVVTAADGTKSDIPAAQHIPINGYANAWLVNSVGPTTISITFASQRFVWYGLWITGLAIVSSVLVLLISWLIPVIKRSIL